MKTILIYDKIIPIQFEKTDYKYNGKIYILYDAKVINPPFFETIIISHNELKNEELKMIYNMLLINGHLIFHKKYKSFFKNSEPCGDDYLYITKKNNSLFIIQYTRVVEFIIAGVQKSGTTALSINISQHPDIYIDKRKDPFESEIHFFDIYWKNGLSYYKKKFNYNKKIVGEKTPDLIYLSYTFPLIQSVNPYVKIILILRNPIDRAYSAWKFITKYFGENRTFEDCVQDELSNLGGENITFYTSQKHYLQRGLYYKQIQELLKWFPIQNILILIAEKVKKKYGQRI